jgi:hypothetical protein
MADVENVDLKKLLIKMATAKKLQKKFIDGTNDRNYFLG